MDKTEIWLEGRRQEAVRCTLCDTLRRLFSSCVLDVRG